MRSTNVRHSVFARTMSLDASRVLFKVEINVSVDMTPTAKIAIEIMHSIMLKPFLDVKRDEPMAIDPDVCQVVLVIADGRSGVSEASLLARLPGACIPISGGVR